MLGTSSCSKGNRSSLRQTKKSVSTTVKDCRKLLNLNLNTADMPVCESTKPGVSVVGCHFTEKAEHVPIKKRRSAHRSQSPLPRASRGDSLLGSTGLKLTSFINANLTWNRSKGSRSSSRHTKKPASTTMKDCRKLLNLNLKTVDMPVCESEKLGVSVLGCRFSEKAEHVPIKKRRLVNRSPSLPRSVLSPHSQETQIVSKTTARLINGTTSANDCDDDKSNIEKTKAQVDENEDFSGICILATTACSIGFGGEDGHVGGSGLEESFVREGPFGHSGNNENAEISTEGLSSSFPALPAENAPACLESVNSSANDILHRNKMEDASKQDHAMASEDLSTSKDEDTVRKPGLSSTDGRLHWDLNREMDSWEHPFDDLTVDPDANAVDSIAEEMDGRRSNKMGDGEGYELPNVIGDSETVTDEKQLSGDSREMTHACNQLDIEDHKQHGCFKRSKYLQENMLSSELHHGVNVDGFEEGKKPSYNQERINTDVEPFLVPAIDGQRLSASINDDQSSSDHNVSVTGTSGDDYLSLHGIFSMSSCAADNLPSKSSCRNSSSASDEDMSISSDSRVKEQEVAPVRASSVTATNGVEDALGKAFADAKEISGSLDDTSKLADKVALEAGQPLKTEQLDIVNGDHASSAPLDVEMPTSTTLVEYQPAVNLKVQDENTSVHDSTETDTSMLINGEEAATKCSEKSAKLVQDPSVHSSDGCDLVNSSHKMTLEEPSDNYSDVSHDHGHSKSDEQEVDYDSQYEDGEVRESVVHAWEDYDGEDMNVAYGSDHANNLTCNSLKTVKHAQETNFQPCLSGSSGSGKEKRSEGNKGKVDFEYGDDAGSGKVTGEDLDNKEHDVEKPSLPADSTVKLSRGCDHKTFSDSVPGVGDGSRMNLTDGCVDIMAIEGAKTRTVGAREFRRELRSHIEGRGLQDGHIKDKSCMQRSSDVHNSNPRSVREPGYAESFGRVRYHAHTRSEEDDHCVNSDRGFKCYRPSNYYGPTSFRRHGPENGSIGRHKMDASLNAHHRFRRSRSPVVRDENFHLRLGFRPSRDLSPDRDEAFCLRLGIRPSRELSPSRYMPLGRGRSLRCGPRLDERGPRGRYHGPVPSHGPFLNQSHPSFKREKVFSSTERRGEDPARKSQSKSPTRSRTRSPNSVYPSAGPRSKSPNFRSGVRMQRGRSPHQRSGFVDDRMVGFRKIYRNRGSPSHHNSRWVGDWKDGMVNFKEQVRFGPRDERFDFVDTARNYRSVRAGRFVEMEGVGRGRSRCDRNDYAREKQGHRFGLVPPAKRFSMDGPVNRFQYNGDERFVKPRNSRYEDGADFYGRGAHPKQFGRGIERSIGDGPRRFRDERGPIIHKDGKYNGNEKSFEVHESDDESASSKRP